VLLCLFHVIVKDLSLPVFGFYVYPPPPPPPSQQLRLATTSSSFHSLRKKRNGRGAAGGGGGLKSVELRNRFMSEYRDLFNTHRRVIPNLYCLLYSSKSFRPAFGLCPYRVDRNFVPLPTETETERERERGERERERETDRRHFTQI